MKRPAEINRDLVYRTLFEASKDAILIERSDGSILEANKSACRLFGYRPEEWSKLKAQDLVLPLDKDTINDLIDSSPSEFEMVMQARNKNGETFTAEVRSVRMNADDEELLYITIQDLTEHKELLSALQKSESSFQILIENLADAVFAHDEDGNFVMVNNKSCENTGYTRKELMRMKVADIDAQSLERDDKKLFWKQLKIGDNVRFEVNHRRKDGSIYPAEINLNLVEVRGRKVWLVTARDISERRQAEERIKSNQKLLKEASQIAAVGSFSRNIEDDTVEWSDQQYKLFGYQPGQVKPTFELVRRHIHPQDLERFDKYNKAMIEHDHPYDVEYRLIRADGKLRYVRSRASLDYDDSGKPVRMYGALQDITEQKRIEHELTETHKIIGKSPVVAVLWRNDEGWPVEFSTSNIYDLTGYRAEDFYSKEISYDELIHPEDLERVMHEVMDFSSQPNRYSFTHSPYRIITRQGEMKWIRDLTWIRRDIDGEVTHFQGIVMDITAQIGTEEALVESEARYRSLFELSPYGIILIDEETKICSANRILTEWLGVGKDELIGKNALDLSYVAPQSRDIIRENMKKRIEGENIAPYEISLQAVGGKDKIVEVTGTVLQGKEFLAMIVLRDITESRLAEQALKDSEERLSMAIKATGAYVFDIANDSDDKGTMRHAMSNLLGYPLEQIPEGPEIPEWIKARVHKEDIESVAQLNRDFFSGKTDQLLCEYRMRDFSGRMKHLKVEAIPKVRNDRGEVTRIVGLIMDITDSKRMEEELFKAEKLESIGVLAGGIAHDFNNILVAILGNISLAQMEVEPDSELAKPLHEAEKATERAKDLTRQLLTFSKGGAPVKMTADITELIRDTVAFSLHGASVRCDYDFAKDLRAVEVDQGQLSQVINNLVINAVQAMPDGGKISIGAQNLTLLTESSLPLPKGEYIHITVQDQGSGIPPEILKKVFDPFFTTKSGGSGLGLASTYSIIRQHEGHIEVESELGKGTKFHIYLPATDKTISSQFRQSEKPITGSGRVLIVDDEPNIRQLAGAVLVRLGYQVLTACDGNEAVEVYEDSIANDKPIDLVILDLTIPGGKGGLEILQDLRKLDVGVRAIVSSGYSTDPVMADYQKFGFVGRVAKPYKATELGSAIKKAFSD